MLMISKILKRGLLLSIFFLLSACQSQASPTGTIPAPPAAGIPSTGLTAAAPPGAEPTLAPEMDQIVALAQEKLAQKFQARPADFILFSIAPATWPDSSLGCPQPGVMYQPVPTPGYQMVFEYRGQTYVVHTDQDQLAVICTVRPPDEIYPTP